MATIGLLLLIPTGTIDDLIVAPFLIDKFGHQAYFLIVITAAYLLYRTTEGKTIKNKLNTVKKELKQIFGR